MEQDLVGQMAKHDEQFAGLMQDVFQNSLATYSQLELNQQRKERLLQHSLGSSASAPDLLASDDIPNLYRKYSELFVM
jgi:hypothetical protein|tara:strand:+ start:234 stop:467 length:234 start_codon:yes stop_codon:yes gene_type:complete